MSGSSPGASGWSFPARFRTRRVGSLPDDPRILEGKTPHLHIMTLGHPDATAELDIPVGFDVAF